MNGDGDRSEVHCLQLETNPRKPQDWRRPCDPLIDETDVNVGDDVDEVVASHLVPLRLGPDPVR